jgi:hypothetical protein
MGQRRCRYCQKDFQLSKFQPRQTVCGERDCQRRRRSDYQKENIASDPEYRQVCRDSPRKWRTRNPDYWKRYREKHPASVERNLAAQKLRDRKRKLCNLANNTSAPDLRHSLAEVWLIGPGAPHLANNNSALAQIWVIEALRPGWTQPPPSCKQHPSGQSADAAA